MITRKIWRQVRDDFNWCCSYCQMPAIYLPQGLETEHIVPRSLGGRDTVGNLCPACPNCNAHKAKKIFAIDPQSRDEVLLFNPRKQKWIEHFNWDESGTQVIGRTNIGRATVAALKMNLPDIVAWRSIIIGIGGYPPKLD
ncbi:HNH endonuclease [candidate division KSB1 bacterium]|nr:HNH endonuclease [candidate division KSB1 bacterium]